MPATIIHIILFILLVGCTEKPSSAERMDTDAGMIAMGMAFRTDPGNKTAAYDYLKGLAKEKNYVAALTILDEMAADLGKDARFRELYLDIVRKASCRSGIQSLNPSYFKPRDADIQMDTLILKMNRIQMINRLINEEGSSSGYHMERGMMLLQLEHFQGAEYDFRQAFDMDTSRVSPYYYLIYAQYMQGRHADALAFLRQYKRSIRDSDARMTETINRLEGLLAELDRIENDPGMEEKTKRLEKGKRYYEVRDFRQAMIEVDRAIGLDENLADAYALRALLHHELNLQDQALSDLEKAERLSGKRNTPLARKIRN
ncbi:MAG: hypothetical protein AMS26_09995 [Bacteroides sp. SM23_62]|jgi:tetratricopeptide (TPR) repeat protein|nr:MAG: hypothetical protein AMS26_09995 [Bacteroides sp. SM23_62]